MSPWAEAMTGGASSLFGPQRRLNLFGSALDPTLAPSSAEGLRLGGIVRHHVRSCNRYCPRVGPLGLSRLAGA